MSVKKRRPTKKRPTKKKPTKKATKKRTPRRATSRSVKIVSKKAGVALPKHAEMRKHAGVDYITDPDGRSLDYHYNRDDRTYKKKISIETFRKWSMMDKWPARRDQYWSEIEIRTLEGLQDKILQMRLEELGELTESRNYMAEYLQPLRDEDGNVRRHPTHDEHGNPHPQAGLPMFPLELPRFDRFIKALLDLDERVMLKRGEAITRTETVGAKTRVKTTALDPVGSLMNLTPAEAKRLAQNLLRQRMGERYEGVLDLVEGDATDGGGTEEEL